MTSRARTNGPRRPATLAAAGLLAAVAMAGFPVPAAADVPGAGSVTCVGTEVAGYAPGLVLTPRATTVTVNGILAPCTSSVPGLTAGTYLQVFPATLSCLTLLDGLAASRVLRWNTGDTSTFGYHRTINNVGGQTTVTFTGTITAGLLQGATAIQQVAFVTPDLLDCLGAGLDTLGPGPSVLTLTRS